jgi:hypothetical protein
VRRCGIRCGSYAGVLYSIARGDKVRVATVTSAPFDGVIH